MEIPVEFLRIYPCLYVIYVICFFFFCIKYCVYDKYL